MNNVVNTLLVYVLDESGSMHDIKDETVSKFNEMQKTLPPNCYVSLLKFTTQPDGVQHVFNPRFSFVGKPSAEVELLDYKPSNFTPLRDAVGFAILETDAWLKREAEIFGKTYKVMLAIHTDGMENASTKFSQEAIKNLIQQKRDTGYWEVIYVGAGENAWVNTQDLYNIPLENTLFTTHDNAGASYTATYVSNRTTTHSKS